MPAHIRGRNIISSYRQNNIPVKFRAKVNDFQEVRDEGWDQVNGERRGRPYGVTDGFIMEIQAYEHDLGLLAAALKDIENDDAAVAPLDQKFGIRIDILDGTSKQYALYDAVRGPFKMNAGGRKETVMSTLRILARFFKEVPALP